MKQFFSGKARSVNTLHIGAILLITVGLAAIYYEKTGFTYVWFPWFRDIVYFEYVNNLNGMLLTIPFIYATVIFWWRGAVTSILLSEIIMFPYIAYMVPSSKFLIYNIIYLCIPALVIGFITIELKWREKERKVSAEREAERKSYTSQIFEAQENERYRIAQELHDDTVQMLYVIANRARDLTDAENLKDISHIQSTGEWIRNSTLNVAEGVRRISLDLRPSILDDLSLVPAARWLVDSLNQENGANIQIMVSGIERKISPEVEVVIFRILQEALNNARKHSKAANIWVTLEFTTDSCKVRIQDNGVGFPLPKRLVHFVSENKLGLIGMRHRAEFLEGSFNIQSEVGKGTTISIVIPG